MSKDKEEIETVSYSESVQVNIGDYEHRNVHISFKTILNDGEEFEQAKARARNAVKKALYSEEKKMRHSSKNDVDFDTISRLRYFKKDGG